MAMEEKDKKLTDEQMNQPQQEDKEVSSVNEDDVQSSKQAEDQQAEEQNASDNTPEDAGKKEEPQKEEASSGEQNYESQEDVTPSSRGEDTTSNEQSAEEQPNADNEEKEKQAASEEERKDDRGEVETKTTDVEEPDAQTKREQASPQPLTEGSGDKEVSPSSEDVSNIAEEEASQKSADKDNDDQGATEDEAVETPPHQGHTEQQEADKAQPAVESAKDQDQDTESSKSGAGEEKDSHDEHHNDEHEEEVEEHHLDYSNYNKKQLVQVLESQLKNPDYKKIGQILNEIKPAYDELFQVERQEAYEKYLEEGGEKDGFEYRNDDLDNRFYEAYNELKNKRFNYFNSIEKQKEQNLEKKQELLERLRQMVDADETVTSIKELKDIQEEWKNSGPVPNQHVKSLWANYNALIDRFYDQRSIYFELKELDRKKNLELKLELCERAEKLEEVENIKEAIKVLNELHEEFKHIGPIPKEDQERVWQRFKAASDAVYARRKHYYEDLKEQLKLNQQAKEALAERVQAFTEFDSERISDWNAKTKEILELQKEWESIGGLPRENAKKINKRFWGAFKTFFNNKGKFFKKIEAQRHENLKLKEELLAKAEELKDSEDFVNTAQQLKDLQKQWKEIGPVPEKFRNEIYSKFKGACDHFFNRKRASESEQEKDYLENLKQKQAICEDIEQMVQNDDIDIDKIDDYLDDWGNIGFVPKPNIKSIQARFVKAISDAIEQTDLPDDEKQRMKFTAQFSKLKHGPNSKRILQKKENSLRRQIAKLENDIVLWKNNISFFTSESKESEKLKEEFNEKIEKATKELESLEEQLRAINNM